MPVATTRRRVVATALEVAEQDAGDEGRVARSEPGIAVQAPARSEPVGVQHDQRAGREFVG